jgi:hypothetical protein
MGAVDGVAGQVTDLVALVYRADWTALSLAADVAEYLDHGAYGRMHEPPRPPWAPDRPGNEAEPRRGSARGVRWTPRPDDDEDGPEAEESEYRATREETYHLLLAPGGCFRLDRASLGVTMSDGHVTWATGEGEPDDLADEDDGEEDGGAWAGATDSAETTNEDSADDEPIASSPAQPPLDELLCPAWLPAEYELELAGSAAAAGRSALRVIGRRRPVSRGSAPRGRSKLRPPHRSSIYRTNLVDRIDALVDADLGILLRCERIHGGQVVSRLEITSLVLDPPEADDRDQFAPPEDAAADAPVPPIFDGPGWEHVKKVADLGASAMSFAMRHGPRREAPAGSRPDPADTPAADGGAWTGQPGPDAPLTPQILALIYTAGLRSSEFDAELRTWGDSAAGADAFKWVTRNTTLSGVTRLGEAMGELARPWQRREAIRIGLPNRFRIDYIDGGMRRPAVCTEATDGAQRWRVFTGHVGVGPAQPLPARIARLVDPAWLLDWRLTGGAEVIEGGRRGFRIRIGGRWQAGHASPRTAPVDAIIDAELGILLRITQAQDGRPAKQQVLAGLRLLQPRDASAFKIDIPIGTRVVQDTGGLIDQLDMPAPVQTAVQLAGKAVATAARVGSFLESVRRQGKSNPGARP